MPIRLPSDSGIGPTGDPLPTSFTDVEAAEDAIRGGSAGAELRAPSSFERPFLDDSLIVLREQKGDVGAWIWGVAISVIAGFYLLFIAGLAFGVARSARAVPATGLEDPGVDEAGDQNRGAGDLERDQRDHVGVGAPNGVDELVGGVALGPMVGVAGDGAHEEEDHR